MKNKIIAVIGAGGKTTLIHRLAEEYRRKGASVLVSTTTHMLVEPDTDQMCIRDSSDPLRSAGSKNGSDTGKMSAGDRQNPSDPGAYASNWTSAGWGFFV